MRRRSRRLPKAARSLPTLMVLALAACSTTPAAMPASSEQARASEAVAAAAAVQPDDKVDLTLYFRTGRGPSAHLTPVVREVPVSRDLPRQALEQLLAGPQPEDGSGLAAVLPPTTRLLGFRLAGDTAIVNLSRAAVEDAATIGAQPEHEALALAALADTLTEFPTVQRVRVFIEGRSGHPFWGSWGLPRQLVRDDSVIGPPQGGPSVPDARAFTRRAQRIGTDVEKAAVKVRSIGTKMRVGYLQLTLELVGGDGEPAAAVPPAVARLGADGVELVVHDVTAVSSPQGGVLRVDDPAFGEVRVSDGGLPGTVRLLVSSPRPQPFFLHTLNNPTRIVLDVRTNR